MKMLAKIYLLGEFGMEDWRDDKLALRRNLRGAQAGNSFCQALLAKCYANGEGVEPDRAEALRLARLSANQYCSFGCYICGQLLESTREYEEALAYYEKAVELGDEVCRSDVARMRAALGRP